MRLRHIWSLTASWTLALPLLAAEVRLGPETALRSETKMVETYALPVAAASNGRGALALLTTFYGRPPGTGSTSLKLVPIGEDGRSTNPAGRNIASYFIDPSYGDGPLLATDGEDYLVVWVNGTTVYSQRVDDGGQPLHPMQVVVSGAESHRPRSLVWNGFHYALIGNFHQSSEVLILDRDGAVVHSIGSIIKEGIYGWVGTHNGQFVTITAFVNGAGPNYAIDHFNESTAHTRVPLSPAVYFSSYAASTGSPDRVLVVEQSTGQFAIADLDGVLVARGTVALSGTILKLTAWWDGDQFVVMWVDWPAETVRAVRVRADGTVRDSKPIVLTGVGDYPVFVQMSSGGLLLSSDRSVVAHLLRGPDALASSLGTSTVVAQYGQAQSEVQIANRAGHRMSMWSSREGYSVQFDGKPLPLPGAMAPFAWQPPSIAAGEQEFLIAADDFDGPLLWRIDFNGQVRGGAPISAGPGLSYSEAPRATPHGRGFLVVWPGFAQDHSEVVALTVGEDGSLTKNIVSFNNSESTYLFPPLSIRGEPLFPFAALKRVWVFDVTYYAWDFQFARGTAPLSLFQRSGGDRYTAMSRKNGFAAVASNGDRVTFVWSEQESKLLVWQTTLDGKAIGQPRVLATDGAMEVQIAWNGTEYVVAWSAATPTEPSPRIRALRLDASAKPIDDAPFFVSPLGATRERPWIDVTPSGVEIAYSRIEDTNAGAPRAFVRSLDRIPPPIVRRRSAGH